MNKILFDMDGTLYGFENGRYNGSKLEEQVGKNAKTLLKILNNDNNLNIDFNKIKNDYGEEFSLAFEEIFGLEKTGYFDIVWDINPDGFINNNREVLDLFEYLKKNGFDIYILSESPKIWIESVLTFLNVRGIITGVFSGQGDERKSNGLLYEKVSEEIGSGYYMIGDQIQSDIVMSKKSGYRPIYINSECEKCDLAEFNISNLEDIKLII